MNNKENTNLNLVADIIILSTSKRKLRKAVFSKPVDNSIKKSTLTLKETSTKSFLQLESLHNDNKATHKNINLNDKAFEELCGIIKDYSQINILTTEGECEYKRASSGKEIVLGGDKLKRKLENASVEQTASISSNNREKKYILDGSEPFLRMLDVSDKNGRIYDKKQSKFRQINRFLELVRDVEDKLPKGEIRICDLCCGKSYLSFAVYHYFANVKGYRVSMTGVDLKPDVVERCNQTAQALGFNGLEFICGDVNKYVPSITPSLVISLHACDIATDFVLNQAVKWNADVILSTPCCHHELNHNIDSPALSFITDYSMLRQKLCDAATDALRLCRLEAAGYSTMALELIDPDETPKNIMLRAVKKKNFDPESEEAKKAMERYVEAKRFLCGQNIDKDLHF